MWKYSALNNNSRLIWLSYKKNSIIWLKKIIKLHLLLLLWNIFQFNYRTKDVSYFRKKTSILSICALEASSFHITLINTETLSSFSRWMLCTVKLEHPTEVTMSKTHFWVEGVFKSLLQDILYILEETILVWWLRENILFCLLLYLKQRLES